MASIVMGKNKLLVLNQLDREKWTDEYYLQASVRLKRPAVLKALKSLHNDGLIESEFNRHRLKWDPTNN